MEGSGRALGQGWRLLRTPRYDSEFETALGKLAVAILSSWALVPTVLGKLAVAILGSWALVPTVLGKLAVAILASRTAPSCH